MSKYVLAFGVLGLLLAVGSSSASAQAVVYYSPVVTPAPVVAAPVPTTTYYAPTTTYYAPAPTTTYYAPTTTYYAPAPVAVRPVVAGYAPTWYAVPRGRFGRRVTLYPGVTPVFYP